MRVRATRLGYYGIERKRPGTEFDLKDQTIVGKEGEKILLTADKQFSKKWMEKVDADEEIVPKPKGKGRSYQPVASSSSGDQDVI